MATIVDNTRFAELVEEAILSLPEEFRRLLENVIIEIEDVPNARVLADLGLSDPEELLGYYTGVPLSEGTADEIIPSPTYIFIYRRNILSICDTEEDVIEEVYTTVLHEIGHHFGMDEDELDRLGYG